MCLFLCMPTHALACLQRSEDNLWEWSFPFTLWIPGIELELQLELPPLGQPAGPYFKCCEVQIREIQSDKSLQF